MRIKNTQTNPQRPKTRIKRKLFGKKVKSHKLSITDSTTEFFEDIPPYRGKFKKEAKNKPSSLSRRSRSTKA